MLDRDIENIVNATKCRINLEGYVIEYEEKLGYIDMTRAKLIDAYTENNLIRERLKETDFPYKFVLEINSFIENLITKTERLKSMIKMEAFAEISNEINRSRD